MNRLVVIAGLFAVSLFSYSAYSLSPQLINYQGRLLDGTNLVNGVVGLSLRLYNTPTGGSPLYEDSNQVTVVDGLYSTFMGDDTTAGSLAVALTNATVYIEVAVDDTALSPRERIVSVAYAFQADRASSVSSADTLDSIDSEEFLRSNTNDQFSGGALTFASGSSVLFDSLADLRIKGPGAGGVFGSIQFANAGSAEPIVITNPSSAKLIIDAPRGISLSAARGTAPLGTIMLTASGGVTVAGNLTVNGILSKLGGSFEIPHPDPAKGDGWKLRHSFVESPTRGDNLYRFVVEVKGGRAVVALPSYFQYLNEDVQVWVSPVRHFGRAWGGLDVDGQNVEVVADQDGRYNVLVVATRKDPAARGFWDEKGAEFPAP